MLIHMVCNWGQCQSITVLRSSNGANGLPEFNASYFPEGPGTA